MAWDALAAELHDTFAPLGAYDFDDLSDGFRVFSLAPRREGAALRRHVEQKRTARAAARTPVLERCCTSDPCTKLLPPHDASRPGPVSEYCSPACKKRAYRRRKKAA